MSICSPICSIFPTFDIYVCVCIHYILMHQPQTGLPSWSYEENESVFNAHIISVEY